MSEIHINGECLQKWADHLEAYYNEHPWLLAEHAPYTNTIPRGMVASCVHEGKHKVFVHAPNGAIVIREFEMAPEEGVFADFSKPETRQRWMDRMNEAIDAAIADLPVHVEPKRPWWKFWR